jgi:RHS repeat-associated protein
MNRTSVRAATLACTLLATTALTIQPAQSSPTFRNFDANGVDIVQGDFLTSFSEGSIGSGSGELQLLRMVGHSGPTGFSGTSQWDHVLLTINSSGTYIDWGGHTDKFPGAESRGSTLSGSGNDYFYTARDGTVVEFTDPNGGSSDITNFCDGSGTQSSCILIPVAITSPNGARVTLGYGFWTLCPRQQHIDDPVSCTFTPRLGSVSNSEGYQIIFSYASGTGSSQTSNPPATFTQRTAANFYNDAVSTTVAQASASYAYPFSGTVDVTDTGGRVWRVTGNNSVSTYYGIRRPGAASDTTSATVSTGQIASSVTNEGVTTSYSRSVVGSTGTLTVTNALSQVTSIVSDLNVGQPTSVTVDPGIAPHLNQTTSFTYDTSSRLTRVTKPEGNYVNYTYDTRGNATEARQVAKSGSGLPDVVATASYPSTCTDPVTCNEPTSTTDARGNTTDYTYDSTHGGVLTVTLPAPTTGGVRPQTRYSYTLDSGTGTYRLTGLSQCQTGSSCTGTSDEVKATIVYDSSGNVTSQSTGSGNGSLTATTARTYDAMGNLLTVDGPLSGTADTTRYRYDAARELVGVISPDPDGSGSLKNRAVRNTYTNGLLTKIEQGTVNSQSDTDWTAFSSVQEVDTAYDSNARLVRQSGISSGTTYAVIQISRDSLGRANCIAQRMNPAVYGSLPSDACTLGTSGSYGPDRITKTTYDAANRATLVQNAYGVTGVQSDDVTTAYTTNGLVSTVKDAEGNETGYGYDGHDRLVTTFYPSTTKGAGTYNASDYEQLTYENTASNTRTSGTVASRRNRANETISFTYNALGRLTTKNLPGTEPDVTYAYDLLGRMTSAATSSQTLSFTYDALGRNLTQVGPQGTMTSTWDIGGRRTQLTWPDSFYVSYDYLVTGEVSAIRENGAVSGVGVLATYAYDNFGRRASVTRGNGTSTSYSYDGASRLTQLTQDLSGTTYDQTLGFGYNPANQIIQNTRSNDAYAWGGHGSGSTSSTTNGLNELTTIGSTTPTYDSKGNMTYAGGTTYSYSSENLLTSSSGGAALTYDPARRLYQVSGGTAGTQRFAYDGSDLIAEYDSSNTMLRRFVHGPGTDKPIIWYEGTGTSDRRFLHADERGTIVAVTNSSGTELNVNTYDEYGKPGSSNAGRFQYTGQAYLPELGLYYYKARMYASGLGRFMQVDPVGYRGGMNRYGYVGGDPVNLIDPLGLHWVRRCVGVGDGPLQCGWYWVNGPSGGGTGGGAGGSDQGIHKQPNMPNVDGGGGDPLNWPHAEPPVPPPTPEENCQEAVDIIAALTALRLGTGFDDETYKVLDSLAFGGPDSFQITPVGMAQLQGEISERPGDLVYVGDVGDGVSQYTFNFAPGVDSQYVFGYSSSTALGAMLGRANVYMKDNALVGVSDSFDYYGDYSDPDIAAGVAYANSLLNQNCPNRQSTIPITGGSSGS